MPLTCEGRRLACPEDAQVKVEEAAEEGYRRSGAARAAVTRGIPLRALPTYSKEKEFPPAHTEESARRISRLRALACLSARCQKVGLGFTTPALLHGLGLIPLARLGTERQGSCAQIFFTANALVPDRR